MRRVRSILVILFPLIIGMISAAISSKRMIDYGDMIKPPLSPPAWVFSVAWTILYLMMGLAAYFVVTSRVNTRNKIIALLPYGIQLFMNFFWTIIFFNWKMYLFALIWLLVMWCIVIFCAFRFYRIRKIAGCLLVPYVLWLTFAAYLNLGSYLLHYYQIFVFK